MDDKEIKKLKAELTTLNKRKKQIKNKLKDYFNSIEKQKYINPNTQYINRDVELLVDYIIKNGRTSSSELIKYINEFGYTENKRWVNKMDGNLFMGKLGNYLQKRTNISKEKIGSIYYWYCNI